MTSPPNRSKQARQEMPRVASFIDDLRAAFGELHINEQIRLATRDNQPVFWASENGREVGVRLAEATNVWALEGFDQRRFCPGCHGECVGTDQPCAELAKH